MKLTTKRITLIFNVATIKHDAFIQYLLSSKSYDKETVFFKVTCEIPSEPQELYAGLDDKLTLLLPKALHQHCFAIVNSKEARHTTNHDVLYSSQDFTFSDNLIAILQSIPEAMDESMLLEYLNVDVRTPHYQALFWASALSALPNESKGRYAIDLFGLPLFTQAKAAARFNAKSWLNAACAELLLRKESHLCYSVSREVGEERQYLSFDIDHENKLTNLKWLADIESAHLFARVPYSQVQEITSAYDDEKQINRVLREYCDSPKQLDALENMLPFLQSMDTSISLEWFTLQN
ncbi:hypothetical protein HC723_14105 [Vibrio sp. S11_S32]|uniref:hypothetical protein n=1 Tax=Vibrio sp. S11_S32 TaxID=2720225 RepID=UPI0016814293|nr:hypothetical protein [Vibrio sp. S11_S32]MBD1577545.1 hypothetical protein [Vibrio sp. S11_S32]